MKPRSAQTVLTMTGGVLLIGLGVLFLLGSFFRRSGVDFVWPGFIVLIGLGFFAAMILGGPSLGGLAVPGAMLVILGLIFEFQTLFDAWASWAYAWALFAPTGVGAGLLIHSWWSNKPELKRSGYTLVGIGLTLFVAFGVFFELVIGLSGLFRPGTPLLGVLLIALGAFLLVGRMIRWDKVVERLPPHDTPPPTLPPVLPVA